MRNEIEILSSELDILRKNDSLNQQNLFDEINNVRKVLKNKIETIKNQVASTDDLKAEIVQLNRRVNSREYEVFFIHMYICNMKMKIINM